MRYFLLIILIAIISINFSFAQNIKTPKEIELKDLSDKFINYLKNEKYSDIMDMFDQNLKSKFDHDKLESLWQSVLNQFGAIKNTKSVDYSLYQQYFIVLTELEYERGSLATRLVFDKDNLIAGFFFAPPTPPLHYPIPEYADTSNIESIETEIGSGTDWALPGSLTYPKNGANFPVLILVHGSGPNDRDETIGPNKPFRDLAYGLTSNGIAVLRYEKRTKTHSGKLSNIKDGITVNEETIDDVLEAVKFIKNEKMLNKKKIFILGHSLGGYLVPRIAQLNDDVAGYIVLAANARPLTVLIMEQIEYILSSDSKQTKEDIETTLAQYKSYVSAINDLDLSFETPSEKLIPGTTAKYWLDLRGYDPVESALDIKVPMFFLQGARDYQVLADKDFILWKNALTNRGNVLFKLYPDLNHLFMAGEGKSTPKEYDITGNVDKKVIEDITQWILNH